ncbi:MAG: hypothetical protein AABO58_13025 [Acidobacteriota bacterium]
MSLVLTVVVVAAVLVLALALAYLPMRLLVAQIARNIAAPIRDFIQRQRDRRERERASPDRRKVV